MRPLRREEIVDYVTWSEQRPEALPAILESKRRRRMHVGESITLLFENRDSVRYQIQEMMRVEKMVKESEIQHEIATYNELLGGPGEIGATLLVEIDDPAVRAQAVGFKGRDLMRKIPGASVKATVMECCGHNGTYAMRVDGFEASARIGRKAFEAMKEAQAPVWATECPLAAIQFQQHAGVKPLHPLTVLARALRADGFPQQIPQPKEGAADATAAT